MPPPVLPCFGPSLLVLNSLAHPAGTMCCTSLKELNILVISAGLLPAACCWPGSLSTPPWPKESSHRERLEETHKRKPHKQPQLIRGAIRQEANEEERIIELLKQLLKPPVSGRLVVVSPPLFQQISHLNGGGPCIPLWSSLTS